MCLFAVLNNKKISLIMDIGSSPEKKFSTNYQSGALSFEIISKGKKLICNSGYFQNQNHQLNELSKSSAVHSTLILDIVKAIIPVIYIKILKFRMV